MTEDKIIMGICPTMIPFAEEIAKKNPEIEIINLGSAAQVLWALTNDQIAIGLIGRKAKKIEFDGYFKELENKKGYTLVTTQKGFILESDLPNIKVYTNVSPEIVKTQYPNLKNVEYVDKFEDNLKPGEIRLVSWDDWNENYELLIPVDFAHNKVLRFRKPFLFSKDEKLIDKILA